MRPLCAMLARILGEVRAAHQFEDDVCSETAGPRPNVVGESAVQNENALAEAEVPRARQLLGAARCADGARSDGVCDLERGRADAAADGVDQDRFPSRQLGLVNHGIPRRHERFRNGRALDER